MSFTTTVDPASTDVSTQTNESHQQSHDVDAVFNCLKNGISRDEMALRLDAGVSSRLEIKDADLIRFFQNPDAMNELHEDIKAHVKDVAGCSQDFSLFENGFEFLKHESKIQGIDQFKDHEKVKEEYWPECIELIKKKLVDHTSSQGEHCPAETCNIQLILIPSQDWSPKGHSHAYYATMQCPTTPILRPSLPSTLRHRRPTSPNTCFGPSKRPRGRRRPNPSNQALPNSESLAPNRISPPRPPSNRRSQQPHTNRSRPA